MSNEQRLAKLRARWKRQAAARKVTAEFKTILPAKQNRTCGMPEKKPHRLQLEVECAIDRNFWGNPLKPFRPKTDPGCGGFGKPFRFGGATEVAA
jgi:hypothetical protein